MPQRSASKQSDIQRSTLRREWKHGRAFAAIDGEPPTRVLLFKWGENESDYGPVFLTRKEAEKAVKDFGNRELMFDLEHLSLNRDEAGKHYDPRAMGWATSKPGIALDEVGMWAEDVKWTDEGARRIRSRETRYTSPAFDTDEQGRIVAITNCAITALPATRFITPLVAASATGSQQTRARGKNMDEKAFISFALMLAGLPLDAPLEDLAAKIREKFTGEVSAEPVPEVDPAAMAEVAPDAMSAIRAKLAGDTNALAALDALSQNAAGATLALSRVAALEKSREADERAAIFREHANKFASPDAMRAYANAPIDALRTFVKFAAPVVDTRKLSQAKTAGAGALTADQSAFATKNKIDHAAYAARLAEPRFAHLLSKGQG